MEKIDNEKLEREFNNNKTSHEVFEHQRTGTLDVLEKRIKDNNEVLFQLSINNIMPFYKHKGHFVDGSKEETRFWNHVVAILFMTELRNRDGLDTCHDIDEEKKIITREDFDIYEKVEDALLDRADVIETIKKLGSPRIHIIARYFNNQDVWKEVLSYLGEDLPFVTMIYSDGEINVPESTYTYIHYDKQEEGLHYKKNASKALIKVLNEEEKI